ncbi:MAG: aminotransferase class I/II-fold pyridoxal phosphate-dependent enzyme, partial [Rhizobiales bacterium]|nr:aminotransferase class I/II-fold pyridoxal phosphate-dependent enzyme [Hyphomicrobiales bacterium]
MNIKATRPEPRSSINKIAAYVPGKSVPTGRDPKTGLIYKLSSNESPLGPSPAAIAAISSIAHLEDYPDGNSTKLRQAIADVHGLNPERIMCGAGSDELLSLLASAYLGEGDEAIYSEHGFLMYKISILATGATPIVALEKDQTAQVDEILAKVSDKTRVVFLANPNNPTGTYLPFDEVKRLHAGLRDDILLSQTGFQIQRGQQNRSDNLVSIHERLSP